MAGYENIMSLGNLTADYVNEVLTNGAAQKGRTQGKTGSTFDSIYQAAIGLVRDTNTYIEKAQQAEIDFALGNITNTHELGAAQQKANLALQYTVAIRDKLMEAYKEIMNLQV